jgi:RNA polymerase sigma-70 factor (ECF subfamily)
VTKLAFRFTGDRDLALDILQETFCYFARKFPGFTLTCHLKTFLYPVVKHLSAQARRKSERFETGESALAAWAESAVTHESVPNPGDSLAQVLERLPEMQREVLLLRFVDEFSLQEIATTLNIPLGTVKSRLHNALETLRNDEATKKFFLE